METGYFNYLLQRVRDIRASERSATAKIGDVLAVSLDYDPSRFATVMHNVRKMMVTQNNMERFANYLLLHAECRAKAKGSWTMSDIEQLAKQFFIDGSPADPTIFKYSSYSGLWPEDNEQSNIVRLPEELQDNNRKYVALRVMDLDRLVELCSSTSAYRARPYDILSQLDQMVVDGMHDNKFPGSTMIFSDNDERGYIFDFSHFEVNLQEPDLHFRTLYVVYHYGTIVS